MPTALKITLDTVEEIEVSSGGSFIQDEEYQSHKRPWDSHCLSMCEHWKHKKFRLSMVYWDMFHPDEDDENPLATYLYRRLKNYDGLIYGPVYIMNEDRDGIIDFTKEDLKYILASINEYPVSSGDLFFTVLLIEVLEAKFPELME